MTTPPTHLPQPHSPKQGPAGTSRTTHLLTPDTVSRVHTPLWQSVLAAHFFPFAQRGQVVEPPQSTSVSPPSCAPLAHWVVHLLGLWLVLQKGVLAGQRQLVLAALQMVVVPLQMGLQMGAAPEVSQRWLAAQPLPSARQATQVFPARVLPTLQTGFSGVQPRSRGAPAVRVHACRMAAPGAGLLCAWDAWVPVVGLMMRGSELCRLLLKSLKLKQKAKHAAEHVLGSPSSPSIQ